MFFWALDHEFAACTLRGWDVLQSRFVIMFGYNIDICMKLILFTPCPLQHYTLVALRAAATPFSALGGTYPRERIGIERTLRTPE